MENIIYVKPHCPYCIKAKHILDLNGVGYKTIDISQDDALVQEMLDRSGGRKTVPQIFIDDSHIGGCDDLEALYLSGGLAKIIEKRL